MLNILRNKNFRDAFCNSKINEELAKMVLGEFPRGKFPRRKFPLVKLPRGKFPLVKFPRGEFPTGKFLRGKRTHRKLPRIYQCIFYTSFI